MVELKIEWVVLINFQPPLHTKLLVCYNNETDYSWCTGYFAKDDKTNHFVFVNDSGGYVEENKVVSFSKLKKPSL